MSLSTDITVDNLKDFYQMILPYLNVGNGGTSDTPLGQVAFFDDLVAPAGWLIADGTVYNIADYPDLANQFERVHGSKNYYGGNGTTTFAVPDLQGEFLRASGTNSHANQGSGASVGEHQDGTEHIPCAIDSNRNMSIAGTSEWNPPTNLDSRIDTPYKTGSHWIVFGNDGSNGLPSKYTSRPTNTSFLLCIKAIPSSEMNTYSTTERRVGTWIDGKPIYQKTIDCGALPNATIKTIPHNISNIKEIYKIEGIAMIHTDSQHTVRSLPMVLRNADAVSNVALGVTNSNIEIDTTGNRTVYTLSYVTLQYTKTTD
jgi:hypothetical protein